MNKRCSTLLMDARREGVIVPGTGLGGKPRSGDHQPRTTACARVQRVHALAIRLNDLTHGNASNSVDYAKETISDDVLICVPDKGCCPHSHCASNACDRCRDQVAPTMLHSPSRTSLSSR
jgi:hypothetical protein